MNTQNTEMENAFNKELHLIKDDLYYQQVELGSGDRKKLVRFDVFYKPLEILGGDSYSIRKAKDGKVVFFLVDAMGKGVSASITATSTTTLLNYIFDQMQLQEDFEFERWIQKYMDYIKHDLLDNEMLSIFFGCHDRNNSEFSYASFGMPAFLTVSESNQFTKIKSNNMPINKYSDEFNIDSSCVRNMKKALFYSDGLCESCMENGEFYREQMYKDFHESHNIVDFISRVKRNLIIEDDDMSFFYIDSIPYHKDFTVKEIKPNKEAIDEALHEISSYLRKEDVSIKNLSETSLALSEILTNALEHGVFNIDRSKKHYLIEQDTFDNYISDLEEKHKDDKIIMSYVIKQEGDSRVLIVRVEDNGKGFDTRELKGLVVNSQNFNGRGIMIIKKLLDRFYYNEKGNVITIRKFLT